MIRRASLCFVIGEFMAKDYSLIFDKEFIPVMNSVEMSENLTLRSFNEEQQEIRMAYIGGLHYNRWNGLILLGDLLSEVKSKCKIECYLDIYSTDDLSKEMLLKLNTLPLRYKGPLNSEQVKSKLIDYDALVHVESEDSESRRATKYSLSTKIPEYLGSKTPIIAFGPDEIASIRILKDNNIGLVLTDLDSREVKIKRLVNFINNRNVRLDFSERGYYYALQNFDNKKIRSKVRDIIVKTVNDNK